MARTTVIELTDDLTGEAGGGVAPVTFALDGVDYVIDLTEKNASDLRHRLAEFITSAKRTGGRLRKPPAISAPGQSGGHIAKRSPQQLSEVRDWARRAGYTVADVGRVSQAVLDAFEAAQAKSQAKPQVKSQPTSQARRRVRR